MPATPMVLIQWESLPLEDASWIPKAQLPASVLEDKDNFYGDRNDGPNIVGQSGNKRATNRPQYLDDYV